MWDQAYNDDVVLVGEIFFIEAALKIHILDMRILL